MVLPGKFDMVDDKNIIRDSFQTEEVFTKDSAEELEKGNNPGPMTEVEFWEAKCENLESLFEQVGLLSLKMYNLHFQCFR